MQLFNVFIAEQVLRDYPNYSELNQGEIYSINVCGQYNKEQEDLFYTLYWSIFGNYFV